jgi:hypothetical protein
MLETHPRQLNNLIVLLVNSINNSKKPTDLAQKFLIPDS